MPNPIALVDSTLVNTPSIGAGTGGVPLPVTIVSGGGGGGGAVTIADGADVALGAKADTAATTDTGSFSVLAFIKRGLTNWTTFLTQLGTGADAAYAGTGSPSVFAALKGVYAGLVAPTPAGTNVIGKVSIDQTTPSTTNAVVTSPSFPDGAIPAGSPYSISAAGVLFTQDTAGYQGISLQFNAIGTGNTISFEGSNDNVNFFSVLADRIDAVSGFASTTITVPVFIPATFRYVRARVSTYASGTVTVAVSLRAIPTPIRNISVSGSLTPAKTTTNGLNTYAFRTPTAASANAANIKASAGQPYAYSFYNAATSARYVHLYNLSTAPTMGTSTDIVVIPIPAGGVVGMNFADIGVAFSAGIGIAVTTAPAANDNTVAGIAAGDVVGMVYYA